jgi:hypothetical protein
MAVPPSQLHWPFATFGRGACVDPVTSGAGWLATGGGKGDCSMRPLDAG